MTDFSGAQQLDQLFQAHFERIARVIGRVIHDQARAEELAVEVFLKWKADKTEGWLYRCAVREALDEWRRQSRKQRFERIFSAFRPAQPQNPEQLYAATEEQKRVRVVLASLSGRDAQILMLWSEGLSYREIADALLIPLNYTGSLISRAQIAFRKEYEKQNAK